MTKRVKYLTTAAVAALTAAALIGVASGGQFAVLDARGTIAAQQRDLLVTATLLMLLIVVPVFILTGYIVWKYRAGNGKATYMPDWDRNYRLEALWWGFPSLIILALSVMIWQSSHALDPFRPLDSPARPLTIQVVALQWKWLFIYPEQGIASVNYLQVPEDTPLNFELTADAPMNSFWIPQLGGQVYAMAGMTTRLHLMADEPGRFAGSSANLSGEGFADMRFRAEAATPQAFDNWVQSLKADRKHLDYASYSSLALPGVQKDRLVYGSTEPGLHSTIVSKYASHRPHQNQPHTNHESHGDY